MFDLDFVFADRGYLFIAGLTLVGIVLIFLSLVINSHVAHNVRADLRHREKLLEYYRNTFSQIGVILIGIGVSLSVFYFQQAYQERSRRNAELQQIMAKMALQLARAAAQMSSLAEFDEILDRHGPYIDPSTGNTAAADRLQGAELSAEIAKIKLVEDDVDVRDLGLLDVSQIFETSFVVNEIDPALWFNIVRDEANIRYGVTQLAADYRDLDQALAGASGEAAAADPQKAAAARAQVLDIFYDIDLLRQSGRRLLARTCVMLSAGSGFTQMKPIDAIETDASTHAAWIAKARPELERRNVGSQNCFALLDYKPG